VNADENATTVSIQAVCAVPPLTTRWQRLRQALDRETAQVTELRNDQRLGEEQRRALRHELDTTRQALEDVQKQCAGLRDSSTDGGRQLEALREREAKAENKLRELQLALEKAQAHGESMQAQATEAAEKARKAEAECQAMAAKLADLSEKSNEVAATNRELDLESGSDHCRMGRAIADRPSAVTKLKEGLELTLEDARQREANWTEHNDEAEVERKRVEKEHERTLSELRLRSEERDEELRLGAAAIEREGTMLERFADSNMVRGERPGVMTIG
jgi:chromosome segregation ATPase